MRPQYKNEDLLKIHPFYNEEIKIEEKKKINAKICTKIPKNLSNKQLSETLPFYPFLKIDYHSLKMQEFQEENVLLKVMQKHVMLKLGIIKG